VSSDEKGLLDLTITQLWELSEALEITPSELAARIDPAVQKLQMTIAKGETREDSTDDADSTKP